MRRSWFYYAGHGIQIGRRNYLIPTDADLSEPADTPFETVTLDHIVEMLSARSSLQVIILDSCRNNPFGGAQLLTEVTAQLYEPADGFQAITPPINTLVAFSTSPGFVAYDGVGGNSPYTSALVRIGSELADESIGQVLEGVRREVIVNTNGAQVPWESSTLIEPFRFATRGLVAAVGEAVAGANAGTEAGGAEVGSGGAAGGDATKITVSERALSASPVVAEKAETGAGIALELAGTLERRLALGLGIAQTLEISAGDSVSLETPEAGRLFLVGEETVPYAGAPLGVSELPYLVYVPTLSPIRASGSIESFVRRDRIMVEIVGEGSITEVETTLTLSPDPCDYHAGDLLDPGGIGLARYPNELEPEAARVACEAAVAASPEDGAVPLSARARAAGASAL